MVPEPAGLNTPDTDQQQPSWRTRLAASSSILRPTRFLLRLTPWRVLLFLGAITTIIWLLWLRCGVLGCPNVRRLAAYQPGGASILYDAADKPFADLAPVDHEVVRLDSLPDYVPAAFVAVEDKRFYRHNGVDPRRVLGAALADLKAGRFVQGFSTITMQLARNVWTERLPGQQRTLKRKILEVRVAREIERVYDKREILELYLNHIYFGSGAYGIEAAARNYFGRPAQDLNLAQAAMLAAMPKSPTLYNPRRSAERVRARRNLVLSLMVAQGLLEPAEADRAKQSRLSVRRDPPRRRGQSDVAAYYADAVRRVLEDRLGEDLYSSPLRIYTALDRTLQRAAEEELERQLRAVEQGAFGRFRGQSYVRSSTPPDNVDYLQGAIVLLDSHTGAVRALVGGRDFQQSPFDRATRARRQAGSAFKPFVYAAALEDGYVPSQHIADLPIRLELRGGEVWEPQNSEGVTEGAVSMRDALVRSKNLPTIRLAADVGVNRVIDLAHDSGIRSPLPDVPSLAIGVASVTPLELTSAYTVFATLGRSVQPQLVERVIDAEGNVVWEPQPRVRRVMDPEVAYVLTDMLSEAVQRGTGTAVLRSGYRGPAAGKTGTTDDGADVWFVGYTPDFVATVWIGFDQPAAIVDNASGGTIAAPVWGRLMRRVYREHAASKPWPRPAGVSSRRVDPNTGMLLAAGCRPERGRAELEMFIDGSEPPDSCPRGKRTDVRQTFLDRAREVLQAGWQRATDWLSRDKKKEQPRREYLGVPRLPRAAELPVPALDTGIVMPKDTLPRLLGIPLDTIILPDTTIRPDTMRVDTIF